MFGHSERDTWGYWSTLLDGESSRGSRGAPLGGKLGSRKIKQKCLKAAFSLLISRGRLHSDRIEVYEKMSLLLS